MQALGNIIIRPFREIYDIADLGPPQFMLRNKIYRRTDLQLQNSRNMILQCSWFQPRRIQNPIPVVVYCHGNCGSRCDIFEILETLLTLNLSVFTFDFGGSGLSDGQYVSLGYFESWDLKTVVEYLRAQQTVSVIALWGRSMGAASSILYASTDPMLGALILDSPFTTLQEACMDLIRSYKVVPKVVAEYLLKHVKEHVLKTAHFKVDDVQPIKCIPFCEMPIIVIHANEDSLIPMSHSKAIFEAHKCLKFFVEVSGTHNTNRSPDILHRIGVALATILELTPEQNQDEIETVRGILPGMSESVKNQLYQSKELLKDRRKQWKNTLQCKFLQNTKMKNKNWINESSNNDIEIKPKIWKKAKTQFNSTIKLGLFSRSSVIPGELDRINIESNSMSMKQY